MVKQANKKQKVISKNLTKPKKEDNLNTGISEENSKKVANSLNEILADEFLIYTKTLNFHWNIEGRDFHALHLFLDDQYHQLQTLLILLQNESEK